MAEEQEFETRIWPNEHRQQLIEVSHVPCTRVMNLIIRQRPPGASLVCPSCGRHIRFPLSNGYAAT